MVNVATSTNGSSVIATPATNPGASRTSAAARYVAQSQKTGTFDRRTSARVSTATGAFGASTRSSPSNSFIPCQLPPARIGWSQTCQASAPLFCHSRATGDASRKWLSAASSCQMPKKPQRLNSGFARVTRVKFGFRAEKSGPVLNGRQKRNPSAPGNRD